MKRRAARIPFFNVRLSTHVRDAVIEVEEALAFGRLRSFGFDGFMAEAATLLGSLLNGPVPGLELWFDYPEPDCYQRYRRRLPKVRFSRPENQVRFPMELSSRSLKRKLHQCGTCYMELRDQARCRDGQRLLQSRTLSIEEISTRLGYTDPANFTRAFRRWCSESSGNSALPSIP